MQRMLAYLIASWTISSVTTLYKAQFADKPLKGLTWGLLFYSVPLGLGLGVTGGLLTEYISANLTPFLWLIISIWSSHIGSSIGSRKGQINQSHRFILVFLSACSTSGVASAVYFMFLKLFCLSLVKKLNLTNSLIVVNWSIIRKVRSLSIAIYSLFKVYSISTSFLKLLPAILNTLNVLLYPQLSFLSIACFRQSKTTPRASEIDLASNSS